MRLTPILLASALALGFSATPAFAYVDIEDVRLMAFDRGFVELEEIELDDGVWEVEGWDVNENKIEMEVDARTGHIIRMERD